MLWVGAGGSREPGCGDPNELWKKQLAEYVAPPLDPGIDEALIDYIDRRKAWFPDSNV